MWISRTSPQLDMVSAGNWGWGNYTTIEGLPDTIMAMCCVNNMIWLGDNAGNIHGYRYVNFIYFQKITVIYQTTRFVNIFILSNFCIDINH